MKNFDSKIVEMIAELEKELEFVIACDNNDARSIANVTEVIKNEEKEGMTTERSSYLYNLLTAFLKSRGNNAVKINSLKETINSLKLMSEIYSE